MPQATKKRNRSTVVCNFCKKRKVKCDKGQPCSSCVKYGEKDCVYEPLGISDGLKEARDQTDIENEIYILSNKIRKLQQKLPNPIPIDAYGSVAPTKSVQESPERQQCSSDENVDLSSHSPKSTKYDHFLGNNPVGRYDDRISFGDLTGTSIYKMGLRRSFPAFSSLCLMRADSALNVFLSYLHHEMFVKKHQLRPSDSRKVQSNTDKLFESKSESLGGVSDIQALPQSNGPPPVSMSKQLAKMNQIKDKLEYVEKLSDLILSMLPCKKVIWKLVDAFFIRVYPLYPVLDQKDFNTSISRIIGPPAFSDHNIERLNLNKRLDFATLGILTLVLRLSYLSCVPRDISGNGNIRSTDPDILYLSKHPIKSDVLIVSRKCLELFDLFTTSSLTVLQLSLLRRLYFMLAPEEGDNDRGPELLGDSMITSMAFSLGIHRERTFSFSPLPPPRHRSLCRKIWHVIYQLNVHHSIFNGDRLLISQQDFDTKFPVIETDVESANIELEKAVINSLSSIGLTSAPVFSMIGHISNVKHGTDIYDLSHNLRILELKYIRRYGYMSEHISQESTGVFDEVKRITEIRTYQAVVAFNLPLLFIFFNYYEKAKNVKLTVHYLKKSVILIAHDFVPFCLHFVYYGSHNFPFLNGLAVVQDIIFLLHRCVLILMSFYLRFKVKVTQMKDDSYNKSGSIVLREEVLGRILELVEILLTVLTKLSSTYFSAWISNEQFAVFMEHLKKDNILEFERFKGLKQVHLDDDIIHDLSDIFHSSISKIKRIIPEQEDVANLNSPADGLGDTVDPQSGTEQPWEELFQERAEALRPNDFMNIGNYESIYIDGETDFSSWEKSLFEGQSLDQLIKESLDRR